MPELFYAVAWKLKHTAFNSLFEMQALLKPRLVAYQLNLSILYLRCIYLPFIRSSTELTSFNSLFEMRGWAQQMYAQTRVFFQFSI